MSQIEKDIDALRGVYMLPSQRESYDRIVQAALSARAQGEELNDWLDQLELPEGYEVEEFLPGIYHYTNTLDGVKMASGDSWNHPALAAISAWQNTTPAVRAVVVDDAMVGRAVDTYAAGHFECCRRHMRAALTAALTQPEVE